MTEVCQQFDAQIEGLEIIPDQVHLLVNVDPQFGIHRLIRHLKGRSSRILRQEYPSLRTRMPSRLHQLVFCGNHRRRTHRGH